MKTGFPAALMLLCPSLAAAQGIANDQIRIWFEIVSDEMKPNTGAR